MESNYLLDVRVDKVNKNNISFYLDSFLKSKKFNMISTINPEFLMIARKDSKFKKVLNNSELNSCDGAGISLAFKLVSITMPKYPGSLMIYDILKFAEKNNKKIFFLGANNESNKKARQNTRKKFPNIKINGYSPPIFIRMNK